MIYSKLKKKFYKKLYVTYILDNLNNLLIIYQNDHNND